MNRTYTEYMEPDRIRVRGQNCGTVREGCDDGIIKVDQKYKSYKDETFLTEIIKNVLKWFDPSPPNE